MVRTVCGSTPLALSYPMAQGCANTSRSEGTNNSVGSSHKDKYQILSDPRYRNFSVSPDQKAPEGQPRRVGMGTSLAGTPVCQRSAIALSPRHAG